MSVEILKFLEAMILFIVFHVCLPLLCLLHCGLFVFVFRMTRRVPIRNAMTAFGTLLMTIGGLFWPRHGLPSGMVITCFLAGFAVTAAGGWMLYLRYGKSVSLHALMKRA